MKINVDLNLGTDFRRAVALAICFTIFLPLATGLIAGLIRGAFGGAVCHPIPGDVFAPASLTPLWYCSISSALLGALCAPLFFAFGTTRVARVEATGTWKEPPTAPHHDL